MTKLIHSGIPAGNWEDKYNSPNPISRFLVRRFLDSIRELVETIPEEIESVTEIGCGEGVITSFLHKMRLARTIKGCDFSSEVIGRAKANKANLSTGNGPEFYVRDIYDITEASEGADLIVCCEVLEHLAEPRMALGLLGKVTGRYCLLSVPNEPLWRIMNMARGKYLGKFGNTPGHVNHWGTAAFLEFVSGEFEIIETRRPIPWSMALCRPKK